jgi:predicted glycogen debranching enzyme
LRNTDHTDIKLEIRPLIAFRDYHGTTHENGVLNPHVESEPGQTTSRPYSDLPALHLAHDPAEIDPNGVWYRNFQYAIEQERGLDFAEDLFNPCTLVFEMNSRNKINIIASTARHDAGQADAYRKAEVERRSANETNLVTSLTTAANQFIVSRESGETVIAGYHWFADWGRDTMIALPGLTLVTGRWDVAKHVLAEFSKHTSIKGCCRTVFQMPAKLRNTTLSMQRCGSSKQCVHSCSTRGTMSLSEQVCIRCSRTSFIGT